MTTDFSFSFLIWICCLGIYLRESSPKFDKAIIVRFNCTHVIRLGTEVHEVKKR